IRMKFTVTTFALVAALAISNVQAFIVCRDGWEDDNTCGFNCKNNDPVDGTWCNRFKSALIRKGANCWGDCMFSNGWQFWCSKNSLTNPSCPSHYWST
ncbi:hypothetical protein BGW38_002992, partial [Lunasporangiospora selenospora]